jgi:hypothetical protein
MKHKLKLQTRLISTGYYICLLPQPIISILIYAAYFTRLKEAWKFALKQTIDPRPKAFFPLNVGVNWMFTLFLLTLVIILTRIITGIYHKLINQSQDEFIQKYQNHALKLFETLLKRRYIIWLITMFLLMGTCGFSSQDKNQYISNIYLGGLVSGGILIVFSIYELVIILMGVYRASKGLTFTWL